MVKADPKRNYYADLEIGSTATTEDIKKQFRKLARIYHPDRNPGNEVEFVPKFQAIQAANEILTDPDQRAKYDADRRRLGYGPRTSPQQQRPVYTQWQTYGGSNVPHASPNAPPYAPGASAYNGQRNAYRAPMPHTPPRPHPNPNSRERVRTTTGFTRPAGPGASAWTEGRPPPTGFRYGKAAPTSREEEQSYFRAFQSFGPKGASQANARKSSTASNAETPNRGRKKSGFDPNKPGADEPSAKTAGYNTRHRPEASGPSSDAEMSGGSNQGPQPQTQRQRSDSSDDQEEVNRRARSAKRAAARKKAADLAAEKQTTGTQSQPAPPATGFASARSGSEADSSGSNLNASKPATPGERVKAVPARKWKNFARSGEAPNESNAAEADSIDPNLNEETPKAPPVNTSFSSVDWSKKSFTFGSPNASATGSQVSNSETPNPFPAPNLFASSTAESPHVADDSNKTAPAPTVEDVSESPEKHPQEEATNAAAPAEAPAPPPAPSPPNTSAGEKQAPVKFSADHWKETFKKPVFGLPKPPITGSSQSVPGVKSTISARRPSTQRIRSPSKVGDKPTGEPTLSGSATRPIVVEEYPGEPEPEPDVDAMEIDTPPNVTEQARGPRLVRVQATRSDWREPASGKASPKGEVTTAPRPSTQTTPSSERRRKSSVRDGKAVPATGPSTLNMSSLKSHLLPQESGIANLDALHVNLPFESRASTQHPISSKYEDIEAITTLVSYPKPPPAPLLPTSGTISEQHYRNLLSAMSAYLGAYHKYEAEVLAQFSLRCKEGARFGIGIPSPEATDLLNAKGEPKGKGVWAYATALKEEKSAREEWVRATEEYMRVVAGWAVLKGMVLNRGFIKGS